MDHIVSGLTESGDHRVQLAAVRCLHSLSRSVQQLRTTFQVTRLRGSLTRDGNEREFDRIIQFGSR